MFRAINDCSLSRGESAEAGTRDRLDMTEMDYSPGMSRFASLSAIAARKSADKGYISRADDVIE